MASLSRLCLHPGLTNSPLLGRQLTQIAQAASRSNSLLRAQAARPRNLASPGWAAFSSQTRAQSQQWQQQQQWREQPRKSQSQEQAENESRRLSEQQRFDQAIRDGPVLTASLWSSSLVKIGLAEVLFMIATLGSVGAYYYVKRFEEKPGILPEVAEAYSRSLQHEMEYAGVRERLEALMAEDAELDSQADAQRKQVVTKQMQSLCAKANRLLAHQVIQSLEQILDTTRDLIGPDDYRLLSVLRKLSFQQRRLVQFQLQFRSLLRAEDRLSRKQLQAILDKVQDQYTDMIRIAQLQYGRSHRQVVHCTLDLASFFFELEDYKNCQQALLTAWERLQEGASGNIGRLHLLATRWLLGQDQERLNLDAEAQLAQMLSETYRLQEKPDPAQAVDWAGVALLAMERLYGEEDWRVGTLLTGISSLLTLAGRLEEAESTARRSFRIAQRYFPDETLAEVAQYKELFIARTDGPSMQLRLAAMNNLGRTLVQQGFAGDADAADEGRRLLRQALDLAKAGGDHMSLRAIQTTISELKIKP